MKEIQKRQNEPKVLELQAVARILYNRAEKINLWLWILPIISYLFVFVPKNDFNVLVTVFCFTLDIVAFLLAIWFSNIIKSASYYRKVFDYYVLGFSAINTIKKDRCESFLKIIANNKSVIEMYCKHTGSDFPPGVKDWYVFNKPLNSEEAIFECQCQNSWWDKKLTKLRLLTDIITFSIALLIFIIICVYTDFSWIRLLLSSVIIIRLIERMIVNVRYIVLSIKIDGAIDILEKEKNKEQLLSLQEKIDFKRELSVVGRNSLHKKIALTLTTKYNDLKRL